MRAFVTILAAAAVLAACGSDEGRGGVTAEEAEALDNAAEMLDASPDSLVPSEDVPLGNGDEPVEDEAANAAAANSQ